MSIILGSDHKYNNNFCKPITYKRNFKLSRILNEIKTRLEDLNITVVRPIIKNMPHCQTLWTRDSVINIDNQMIMLPLQSLNTRHPDEWRTIPVDRRKVFPDFPENLEGGDVIQDHNLILIGEGIRSNKLGIEKLKRMFPKKKIIDIKHSALHLDCVLMVLPGKEILYSSRYIKKLPKYLKQNYKCKTVESIIGKDIDPLLATNGLIIGNNIITTDQVKFKKFRNYLRKQGFNVIEISYGNLWREQGGIRCLTQWLKKPETQLIS